MFKQCIAACAMLTVTAVAHADFKYHGSKSAAYETQSGFEQVVIPSDAFGDGVSLADSIKLIVGRDAKIDIGNDLDPNVLISWRGGQSRGVILDEIFGDLHAKWWFESGNFYVRSKREVQIAQELGLTDPAGNPTANVVWPIDAPTTVQVTMENWMSRLPNGQVKWLLPANRDCALTISGKITGTIDDAIQTLISQSDKEGQCFIPYARITGNNILVVKELLRGNFQ